MSSSGLQLSQRSQEFDESEYQYEERDEEQEVYMAQGRSCLDILGKASRLELTTNFNADGSETPYKASNSRERRKQKNLLS